MQEVRPPQVVIKSWFVVAVPDGTKPDEVKKVRPVKCSGDFVVRDAAEEYARLMRKWSKFPDTVCVMARQGYER
jgi:hypothetical protein